MKGRSGLVWIGTAAVVLSACASVTDDPVGSGAVGGSMLGAGLGAVIGGTSGDAGEGMAIGAAAGAAAGAAVGSIIKDREGLMEANERTLEYQKQLAATQAEEIKTLKQLSAEQVEFKDSTAAVTRPILSEIKVASVGKQRSFAAIGSPASVSRETSRSTEGIMEANLPVAADKETARGSYRWGTAGREVFGFSDLTPRSEAKAPKQAIEKPAVKTKDVKALRLTPECLKARAEIQQGGEASEVSDRLFHFRRALRLCPDNPEYHNILGEFYVSLNRNVDAEFEFQQALNLDPENEKAKNGLLKLSE